MGEISAIPIWLCIPFAGLLLSIAVMPLFKPDWWEKHQPLAVAFWSILFIIPFTAKYGIFTMSETVLECVVNDYLTFIVLLFGLFCVAGNITLEGDFAGSPRLNVAVLAFGTLLSSCIGTTGASMLLVRPVLKMNAWRRNKRQLMVFFIFMVSHMGEVLCEGKDALANIQMILTNNFDNMVDGQARYSPMCNEHGGTVRKLKEENIPLIPHRARQMTRNDYLYYDYLIGMDTANIRNMIRIAGGEDSQEKIYKMLSFAGYEHTRRLSEAGDVADPWYTGDFEATYQDVKNGCEGLMAYIKENYKVTL